MHVNLLSMLRNSVCMHVARLARCIAAGTQAIILNSVPYSSVHV